MLPQAVLIMGLNSRRPYDKNYEEWVNHFRSGLAVSLAAVLSWEAETQRAQCVVFIPCSQNVSFTNALHPDNLPNWMLQRHHFSAMSLMN